MDDVKHGWPHGGGLHVDLLAHHWDRGMRDIAGWQGRRGNVLYGCCHWSGYLVRCGGVLGRLIRHLRSSLWVHPLLRDVRLLVGIHDERCGKTMPMYFAMFLCGHSFL